MLPLDSVLDAILDSRISLCCLIAGYQLSIDVLWVCDAALLDLSRNNHDEFIYHTLLF